MKAETARLLRAVLRLVEDDVRELADAVVEIDEREAANVAALKRDVRDLTTRADNQRRWMDALQTELDDARTKLTEHVETYDRHAHPAHPVPDGFSVKA